MTQSKTFCLYPFTHMEISNDGTMSPCCRYDGNYQEGSIPANINKNNIDEVMSSVQAVELRNDLLSGKKHSNCHRCWRDEKLGLDSQRLRYNQRFVEHITDFNNAQEYNILSYDLKLGNTCNQMCIICNSYSSSMIATEEKQILKFDWYRNTSTMEKIYKNLENIKHIEFYGGEPWLIKQHWELLEKLISLDKSKEITLNYATNGSLFKDEYFTNFFKKFKKVSILYSADGIENTFNYCRYPASWDTFQTNLKNSLMYFDENITCRIGYTVSIYSVFDIINSLKYYSTLSNEKNKLLVWFNLVNQPSLGIKNLPNKLKNKLINQLSEDWVDSMPASDKNLKDALIKELSRTRSESDWQLFVSYTKNKNRLRNNSIIDIIPEFKKYF
jgi:organic radical activating enzyme